MLQAGFEALARSLKKKQKKRPRSKYSSDGYLAVCQTCFGEGEFLFPEPLDVPELGKNRLPCGKIVVCYVCHGAGTRWIGSKL